MKCLLIVSIISLLNLIFSKNNATSVLVIESAACGNCKNFNYRDVGYILKKQNFQEVVNIKLLPTAHLMEQRVNGTFVYSHRFGEDNLRIAFAQICANNLYTNINALKWASISNNSKKSLNQTIREVFPDDDGVTMINCVYGRQGHEFARGAWLEYLKNALGGMLPIVIVDGIRQAYSWDRNGFFFDSICRNRTDKAELVACVGVNRNEFTYLFEENYDNFVSGVAFEDEVKEIKNEDFDYKNFWATPDEEDIPLVGFESKKNADKKKQHLKFFDDDDE